MNQIIKFSLILVQMFIVSFASCQADTNAINNDQFIIAAKDTNTIILDLRTIEEFKQGYIEKAVHIDVLQKDSFTAYIANLPKDKNYLLYCRSGKRSATALNIMKENGFVNVKHLKEGVTAWKGPIIK